MARIFFVRHELIDIVNGNKSNSASDVVEECITSDLCKVYLIIAVTLVGST